MDAVASDQLRVVLEDLERGLDALDAVGAAPVDGRDTYGVVRRLEAIARRVRAQQLAVVGDVERRRLFAEDGHRSARAMVGFAAKLSGAESARRARAARALRDLPAVAAGLAAGRIGCCQVDRIARVHANARVREQLVAVDGDLAVVAERLSYDELDRYLRRWEYLADEDGAAERAERDHRRRDFSIRQNLDGSYRISGGCGSLQGTVSAEILDAYCRAELEADWADARVRVGEDATIEDLARTDAQRRMDALEQIFRDAADHHRTATGHQLVTNLVIDQDTFERTATRIAGADPGPDARLERWWSDIAAATQPDRQCDHHEGGDTATTVPSAATYRCETADGTFVDPTEAVAATLTGHIRRVVYGSNGVVLDVGRAQRLFTGNRRLAVLLNATTCIWPGCSVPASRCQGDHLAEWSAGGRTNPDNGAPTCGKHNRHRNHGFTIRRDTRGTLHVHRPDGTEIT
jgi:hypothetical protein